MVLSQIKALWAGLSKNQIWSGVIASVIASAIIYFVANPNLSLESGISILRKLLGYQFSGLSALLFVGVLLCIFLVYKLFSRKKTVWDEEVGRYKFEDLYTILKLQKYPIQTLGMKIRDEQAPDDDLADLFLLYFPFLSKGISIDCDPDLSYLYAILAPIYHSHGLLIKEDYQDKYIDGVLHKYFPSDAGYKFFSLLQRIHLLEPELGLTKNAELKGRMR